MVPSTPATQASQVFLEHPRHVPTRGPLQMLLLQSARFCPHGVACPLTSFSVSHSVQFSPVVQSRLTLCDPRPSCPSPTPRVYPNSCPLSRWCHPTFSSSLIPFSSCPQFFPTSESFQMSQLFASGGQSIRVSASTSVLLMNTQD